MFMGRREFITLLGSSAVAWPLGASAQSPSKRPLVAYLGASTKTFSVGIVGPFLQGMRELGYVDGNNIDYEFRYSEGYQDRLPALAAELAQLKPKVIVASAMISAVAAKNATSTIPIVSPGLAQMSCEHDCRAGRPGDVATQVVTDCMRNFLIILRCAANQ